MVMAVGYFNLINNSFILQWQIIVMKTFKTSSVLVAYLTLTKINYAVK